MGFSLGLRPRVTLGFALIGAAVGLGFGGWVYLISKDLDQRLIDEALSAELQDYRARLARNPESLPPMTATLRGYRQRPERPDERPGELNNLPPGRFNLAVAGTSYRVAVVQQGDDTLYMLHNRSQVQDREQALLVLVLGGIALTSLAAAAGGWWLAGRVIAPVRELARRVRERQPDDLTTPLTEGLPGDEVGELARAFERYLARFGAFVERERAFSADASHELRTPIAVIQGAMEILQADPALTPAMRTRVERAARACRAMADLTSALLMLARERRDDAPEPPCRAVAEVLREVVEQHQPLLRHKPVALDLRIQDGPPIPVERPLLAIALGNLVRNAFLYTEAGQVAIRLEGSSFSVADTGAGIPMEELSSLFEHSDRSRRATRGAGIGLPLVKRIADRQGWSLSVENQPEGGARFQLNFKVQG